MIAPFVPDRFASTVPFYRAHRPRYPDALLVRVATELRLARGSRVLDLGCGPGFLAIGFAQRGCAVLGLDPDAAMLEAARAEASEAGVEAEFRAGSSYDLTPALGTFALVAMGRSFHWMDRPATLKALETIVEPHGAVALFGDDHEHTAENGWRQALRGVQDRFAAPDSFSHRRREPGWVGHVATLIDSTFKDVSEIAVWERRSLTLEGVVGRGLSMSGTSPGALGERRPAFEAAVREAVLPFARHGDHFSEVVKAYVTIARRSREG